MKIYILHTGRANYPEIQAYTDFFSSKDGVKVESGTIDDYKLVADKATYIVWCLMGFFPQTLEARAVIHDYRSLSVGRLVVLKDWIKKTFNARPSLRIFQNKEMEKIMAFGDGVPSVLLPMGVPDWVFDLNLSADEDVPKAKFCYIGVMSRERKFDEFLSSFVTNRKSENDKIILVGDPEREIYEEFSRAGGVVFTGKLPQRDALKVVLASEIAVCYFPYHRPHCFQTPTKLLEYAALGKPVVCNDAPAAVSACGEYGIESLVTGEDIFQDVFHRDLATALRSNDRDRLRVVEWNRVIGASGVWPYLLDLGRK